MYWLFKTEPSAFSWQDLMDSPAQTTTWDGVRNYQARNLMRDMKEGELGFFYHSVVKPQQIMGVCKIVREAYPDHTQFDPASKYYDPKSDPENPRWSMVDVQAVHDFTPPLDRDLLKNLPELSEMVLMQKGSRLSVQPVTEKEWQTIINLAKK